MYIHIHTYYVHLAGLHELVEVGLEVLKDQVQLVILADHLR